MIHSDQALVTEISIASYCGRDNNITYAYVLACVDTKRLPAS